MPFLDKKGGIVVIPPFEIIKITITAIIPRLSAVPRTP